MRRCKGKVNFFNGTRWETKEFELGYFHQFGVAYEEFDAGPGNYSTAIVELPDGRIITPVADDITFIDEPEQEYNSLHKAFAGKDAISFGSIIHKIMSMKEGTEFYLNDLYSELHLQVYNSLHRKIKSFIETYSNDLKIVIHAEFEGKTLYRKVG